MKQLILQDEYAMCADVINTHFKKLYEDSFGKQYTRAYVVGDDTFVGDYFLRALAANNAAIPMFRSASYLTVEQDGDYRRHTLEDTQVEVLAQPHEGEKSLFFYFYDGRDPSLIALNTVLAYMRRTSGSRCIVTALLPDYPAYSADLTSLAEREFNYYIETRCKEDAALAAYVQMEATCRQAVATEGLDVTLLRFSNVIAPDHVHLPGKDLVAAIEQSFADRKVTVTDADRQLWFSVSYIRQVCYNVFLSANKALTGHVYNADTEAVTMQTLKELIYKAAPSYFALSAEATTATETAYKTLGSLKLTKQGIADRKVLPAGIQHLVSYVTELEYDNSENVAFYCGKIDTIQALEIEILKKIDAICREHDIRYFLAGGTLLGAIRSGCSIPWDDDLDIGMLRDDFEKFRKVSKLYFGDEFSYSCPKTGNHYTIDKVRLDGTYFSTNFSKKNVFPDGVFVDLLIYDRTSNFKLFQKLHGFLLTALTTLIYIKWYNVPRKNYHYWFSRLTLPLLRLIPWCVFHGLFNWIAKWYRHKKNARYLIDSVGKKVNDGPLPNEGLDETVYVDFQGIRAPIPVDPVPYLTYAYGPNYMQKPVLSKRRCPHNFARIDLGRYVFGYEQAAPFREVDIRGELFETE